MRHKNFFSVLALLALCLMLGTLGTLFLHAQTRSSANVLQYDIVEGMYHLFNPGAPLDVRAPLALDLVGTYTNATTTFSNVVGTSAPTMQFNVAANANYGMDCYFVWQGSLTTAGPKWQITGPASPTAVVISADGGTGAAAYADAAATAFSTAITAFGTAGAGTTNFVSHIHMILNNGPNSGQVVLQAAANGSGTLTIEGGYCRLE